MRIVQLLLVSIFLLFFPLSAVAQPSDRDLYEASYRSGDYSKAISNARQALKKNSSDWHAHYYVGLSFLKQEKEKEALKAFEKAVVSNASEPKVRAALAYAYMLRNDWRASNEANEALRLDKQSAEANYVLAVMAIRDERYTMAYDRAKAAIAVAPGMGAAHLVKSQSLISSFVKQSDTILRPENKRYELLSEAASDIDRFLTLEPNAKDAAFYRGYVVSLRFFSDYYTKRSPSQTDAEDPGKPDPNKTPLKIVHKVKAQYTDRARQAGVRGRLSLLVEFSSLGEIGNILLVKPLGYGLDEQAIAAARKMRFEPERENGVAVTTVRPVSFTFDIY